MSTETANHLFNVVLYGLYFNLWIAVSLLYLVLSRVKGYFILGFVFISAIYLPGQFSNIAWDAKNDFVLESFCLWGMASVFLIKPETRKVLKITGWVFTRVLLAMMTVNAIYIVFPGSLEFVARYCGTIDNHPVNGEFLRVQIENFLWCLLCIGLIYSGYKDLRETDYGQNFFKKIFSGLKMVTGS